MDALGPKNYPRPGSSFSRFDAILDLECEKGFRNRVILSLGTFGLLALLISIYTVGSCYFSVSGYGNWGVPGQEMVAWLCLLGVLVMVGAIVALPFHRIRGTAVAILLGSTLLVVVTLVSLLSADSIRRHGFERLAQEAAPLVSAIVAYEKKHGQPPQSLHNLKIDLPTGHSVKGGSLPNFTYYSGHHAYERYHGNPWVLLLQTPSGPLKWDMFLYYPRQNYPTLGLGGWFEKIGNWAYVHE